MTQHLHPDNLHTWVFSPDELKLTKNLDSNLIKIWNYALSRQLKKDQIWDLSKIPQKQQHSFIVAASYYLRGVCCYTDRHIFPWFQKHPQKVNFTFLEKKPLPDPDTFVVIDQNVLKHWDLELSHSTYIVSSVTEKIKDFSFARELVKHWKALGSKKSWTIIGGGVLTDVAAFACSRVRTQYQSIPTTLVATVDAAIGGKTAVNVPAFGKNLIGSIWQPQHIWIWPGWCQSLSKKEFYEGACEALKHLLLANDLKNFFLLLEKLKQENFSLTLNELKPIVAFKIDIVNKDPFEKHLRKKLNLGHTLAHALEALSQKTKEPVISHGQAVAIGIIYVFLLSYKKKFISKELKEKAIDSFLASGCVVDLSKLQEFFEEDIFSQKFWNSVSYHLRYDKKNKHNKDIQWVLLNPEKPTDFLHPIKTTILEETFQELLLLLKKF